MRGQVTDPAHRLADRAEGRLVAVRPVLAVAGYARDHQPRIDLVQVVRAEPQFFQLPGAHVLHQHIRPRGQRQRPVAVLLQVQLH